MELTAPPPGRPIGMMSLIGSVLVLVLNVTSLCIAAVTPVAINVTIPPLLQEGPPKGELLFAVTHDPQMDPESLVIPCKADGLPPPKYSWLKDGNTFQVDPKRGISMRDGEGTLVFLDPRPEDEGSYQCIASNAAGAVRSDIADVRRYVAISFPKGDPRVITVNLADPLSLTCDNPGGYPRPSLHWVLQRSDGSLRTVSSPTATVDEDGTLWFSSVSREDASDDALYACAASSSTSGQQLFVVTDEEGILEGMTESEPDEGDFVTLNFATEYRLGNWVYLNVTLPLDDPKATLPEAGVAPFQQHVSKDQHSMLTGDDLRLFCIYGGIPTPEVLWWREDGEEIDEEKKIDFGKGLEFLELSEEDQGVYKCRAENENGQGGTHSFTIDIESSPEIIEEPGTVNQPIGDSAIFRCLAKGEPKPTIIWSVNGQVLPDQHKEELHFAVLNFNDKGVVACNATNKHGYDYATGFLNVLSLPPEFTAQPVDTAAFLGQSVTVGCTAYGAPDPKITWKKIDRDDKGKISQETELEDGGNYDFIDQGLLIKSLDENSAGEYECKASNRFDKVSSSAIVTLLRSTSVTLEVEPTHASTGQRINLTCSVSGDSPLVNGVTWMKDDQPLDDSRFTVVSEVDEFEFNDEDPEDEDNDTRSHFIKAISLEDSVGKDSGLYSCVATTEVDEAEGSSILFVEDVPDPPHINNVECAGTKAYIHWASGHENNTPTLSYVIQVETDANPGEWEEVDEEIRGSLETFSTSSIVDLRPSLSNMFRVIAINRVGRSDPSEPQGPCLAPGVAPYSNPNNVSVDALAPSVFVVRWQTMEPELQNGKDFRYEVLWRSKEDEDDEVEVDQQTDLDDGNSEWSTTQITDWQQNESRLEGLERNTFYEVKVRAANEHGYGPQNADSLTLYSGAAVPTAAPTRLRVRRISASSAILAWIPISVEAVQGPLSGYQVELKEDTEDGDDKDVDEIEEMFLEGRTSRAMLTNLEAFTVYHVRVRARNVNFYGPFSDSITFQTAQSASSPVTNLKIYKLSSSSLLVQWEPPSKPKGEITSYLVQYRPIYEEEGIQQSNYVEEIFCNVEDRQVKLSELDEETKYEITVIPRNAAGAGEKSIVTTVTKQIEPKAPAPPSFSWEVVDEDTTPAPTAPTKTEKDQLREKAFLYDRDGDGDIDIDDIIDSDNDGDVDKTDFDAADIDNDGDVDMDDVIAGDKDGDGDIDINDIGDKDGDGDFDSNDVFIADSDGDGDIDTNDRHQVILVDLDGDGDVDEDDVVDIDGDGDIDQEDIDAVDLNNDGNIDIEDLRIADRDGDGDIDSADMPDFDQDGFFDKEDFLITDKDGDGDIDRKDYELRNIFIGDIDNDGDVDREDLLDLDGDGDVDENDFDIADINNDGELDRNDVLSADRDGDGKVDADDIGDEDNDGDIDGQDLAIADEDGDGDIDAKDDDGEGILIVDLNDDGKFDISEISDIDGDGDVDLDDIAILDINNDNKIDDLDMQIIDKDGDGDVDQADVIDFDSDGKIDSDDLQIVDRDGDGDIDATDIENQQTFLRDVNKDGKIDKNDVLDLDGDGDVDIADFEAADLDNDGDVDIDDLKAFDRDGDGDIDKADVSDLDQDGQLDEDDITIKDRDGDGDIDENDFALKRVFLTDVDKDGDFDRDDVIDLDGDGDIDNDDFEASDINKDGIISNSDIIAGDRDRDGDVDFSDIGDENNDNKIDIIDLIEADEDGDGDIDYKDDDGDNMLLFDRDGDGDIDEDDLGDVDGDNDIDDQDFAAMDIDNDGDIDMDDVRKADRDNDGDIDAADIMDFDGDGDIDGLDVIAGDKDQDGDIDQADGELRNVILKDINNDGKIDVNDVIDTDADGDIDQEDINVADINNDGEIDINDILAADQDGDGDIDANDIGDVDGDGDIDGSDVELADRDGDGDIDQSDDLDGVEVAFKWEPIIDEHPGSEFYIEYRHVGEDRWKKSIVEKRNLKHSLKNLDPSRAYEVRMVAKDGQFETPSEAEIIGPFAHAETIPEPTLGAVTKDDPADPLLWTWFIVSVMAAVTMICIIFFSIWVYHHRLGKVAELRAQLYEGYEPPLSTEEDEAAKNPDLETGLLSEGKEAEEPLTAEKQRQQMAALMRRQETVQSVDSFASHDDDFAEYGDESMSRFNEDGSLVFSQND